MYLSKSQATSGEYKAYGSYYSSLKLIKNISNYAGLKKEKF